MRKTSHQSAFFNRRALVAFVPCATGLLLIFASFAPSKPAFNRGPTLALLKTDLSPKSKVGGPIRPGPRVTTPAISASSITFGHPIIAGIGGTGFEESIRIDPTLNAKGEHTIYT